MVTCVEPSASTHSANFPDRMRVRCSLSLDGECKDHSFSSIVRDQHRCGDPAQIAIVNAHKWKLIIMVWMLLMFDVRDPSQPHNACTNARTFPLVIEGVRGFDNSLARSPSLVRRSRNRCSVTSQALPLHVIRICIPLVLHSFKIKVNHVAPSSHTFTSHGSCGLSSICDADFWTQDARFQPSAME